MLPSASSMQPERRLEQKARSGPMRGRNQGRHYMNMHRKFGLLLGSLLFLTTLATTAFAQNQTGIRVTGTGTVYGEPDAAVIEVGINVANPDVNTVTEQANEAAQAIIDSLQEAGVAENDIRTGTFNMWRE